MICDHDILFQGWNQLEKFAAVQNAFALSRFGKNFNFGSTSSPTTLVPEKSQNFRSSDDESATAKSFRYEFFLKLGGLICFIDQRKINIYFEF